MTPQEFVGTTTTGEPGQTLPLSETHRRLLEAAEAAGFGDADNSAVIRAFTRSAGPAQIECHPACSLPLKTDGDTP